VQADRGIAGSMGGHAATDMSVQRPGSFASRLFSRDGYTAVAHMFVMEWAAIIRDLIIGLIAAGAIAAWVPDHFRSVFFIAGHPLAAKIWGPLIGPFVAIISFVCSIGNIPLAVVLWKGGISFGGVIAFIFADLIIAPILNIYRKYYGARMALFLLGTFYAAMAAAGYVELVFGGLGLIPDSAHAKIPDQGVSWDYTTWLNIVFLILAAVLIVRFVRTGRVAMLRMMGGSPQDHMDAHASHTHKEDGRMDQDRARSLLIAERDEVRRLLKETETAGQDDRVAEVESEAEDNADAALALTEEGEDDALAESLHDRLDAIERALHRLDDGTYGRSVRSGEPIPDERLEADPAAELTIEEARAAERG
jgi:uncharacterized membrane protein YraQ (UPF0718 family)/RNA polymerase-binding transcription factor DksA